MIANCFALTIAVIASARVIFSFGLNVLSSYPEIYGTSYSATVIATSLSATTLSVTSLFVTSSTLSDLFSILVCLWECPLLDELPEFDGLLLDVSFTLTGTSTYTVS